MFNARCSRFHRVLTIHKITLEVYYATIHSRRVCRIVSYYHWERPRFLNQQDSWNANGRAAVASSTTILSFHGTVYKCDMRNKLSYSAYAVEFNTPNLTNLWSKGWHGTANPKLLSIQNKGRHQRSTAKPYTRVKMEADRIPKYFVSRMYHVTGYISPSQGWRVDGLRES